MTEEAYLVADRRPPAAERQPLAPHKIAWLIGLTAVAMAAAVICWSVSPSKTRNVTYVPPVAGCAAAMRQFLSSSQDGLDDEALTWTLNACPSTVTAREALSRIGGKDMTTTLATNMMDFLDEACRLSFGMGTAYCKSQVAHRGES